MNHKKTRKGGQPLWCRWLIPQTMLALLMLALCATAAFGQQRKAPQRRKFSIIHAPDNAPSMGVLVSPTLFKVAAISRQKGNIEIMIKNPGPRESLPVRLQLLSFLPEPEGALPYKLVETHPHDATPWFTSNSETVTLGPNQQQTVRFTFRPPAEASGCFWTVMRVTCRINPAPNVGTDDPNADKGGYRFWVPIMLFVGKVRPALMAVSQLDCKPQHPGDRYNALGVTVSNDSEGYSPLGMEAEIRNRLTRAVVQQETLSNLNLLPQCQRRLYVRLKPLPDGSYHARVRVLQGLRRLPPIETDFVVVKSVAQTPTQGAIMSLAPVLASPSDISLELKPGQTKSITVSLVNNAQRPLHLHLTPCLLKQSRGGAIGADDGDLPADLRSVSLFPDAISLEPNSERKVRLRVQADRQASGQVWFGAKIEEVDNTKSLPETIYVNAVISGDAKPKPKLQMSNLSLEQKDGRPTALDYVISNQGNLAVIPEVSAVLLKEDGITPVAKLLAPDIAANGILPGSEIDNRVGLPPLLKPGNYFLGLRYKYGPDAADVVSESYPFVVRPRLAPASAPAPNVRRTSTPTQSRKQGKPIR